MENFNKGILISVFALFALAVGFYFVSSTITKYTGFSVFETDAEFKACLQTQDITLYISTNNLLSLKEIKLFDYLQYVKMINCFDDNKICLEHGVDSFPTWTVNENKIEKDISLSELKKSSGCS